MEKEKPKVTSTRRSSAPILFHVDFRLLVCHALQKSSECLDLARGNHQLSSPHPHVFSPMISLLSMLYSLHAKVSPTPISRVLTLMRLHFHHVCLGLWVSHGPNLCPASLAAGDGGRGVGRGDWSSVQFYILRSNMVVSLLPPPPPSFFFLFFLFSHSFLMAQVPFPLWTPTLIILESFWTICSKNNLAYLLFFFISVVSLSELCFFFFSDYCYEKKDSTEFKICNSGVGRR